MKLTQFLNVFSLFVVSFDNFCGYQIVKLRYTSFDPNILRAALLSTVQNTRALFFHLSIKYIEQYALQFYNGECT